MYNYIYIYTSVNPCISMHRAEWNRAKRCRAQGQQRQPLRTASSNAIFERQVAPKQRLCGIFERQVAPKQRLCGIFERQVARKQRLCGIFARQVGPKQRLRGIFER